MVQLIEWSVDTERRLVNTMLSDGLNTSGHENGS